jgi:hypothetical protein
MWAICVRWFDMAGLVALVCTGASCLGWAGVAGELAQVWPHPSIKCLWAGLRHVVEPRSLYQRYQVPRLLLCLTLEICSSQKAAAKCLLFVWLDAGRRCVCISAEGATLGHLCSSVMGKRSAHSVGAGLIAFQPQCAGAFQNLAATMFQDVLPTVAACARHCFACALDTLSHGMYMPCTCA